jgi:hypothetical protein
MIPRLWAATAGTNNVWAARIVSAAIDESLGAPLCFPRAAPAAAP